MKRFKVSLAIVLVALFVAATVLSATGATAGDVNNDSGVSGLQGPEFTLGIFVGGSLGNNPLALAKGQAVFNGAPYALSGYVLSKFNGSMHMWIAQCSQVVLDLGFKPGDVVEIICSTSQVKDLNSGDFVEVFGFTVRGYLVRGDDAVLASPFSY